MKVLIQSVPLEKIRCSQCGDWRVYRNGTVKALSAIMDNEDSEFAVGEHEAIEAWLCRKSGITDEEVTTFDALFEEERARGLHTPTAEAGDDLRAPYRNQHIIATLIERMIIDACGMTWSQHEANVNSLFDPVGEVAFGFERQDR